jgi:peptidoglycan/xylan/chitin deacetylase (PgdA/CDA1 family)
VSKGTFIFSLDCEGYWGMADVIADGPAPGWPSAALAEVYARLLALFERFETPATWAFVAAFVHTAEEMRGCAYLTQQEIPYRGRDWATACKRSWAAGDTDGWLCPEALELVRAAGAHEVAAHGFSHLPLDETDTTATAAARELKLLAAFWEARGLSPDTFVFPRNQPGHLEQVGERYAAYRPPHRLEVRRGAGARLLRLVDEMSPFVQPAAHGTAGERPAALPPAQLLNHRAGGRRLVPPAITLLRIRRLLRRAIETGRVVHLYSHPHNFLTGQGQFELLAEVLALVQAHVSSGELQVMTQSDYAARMCRTV